MPTTPRLSLRSNPNKRNRGWVWAGLGGAVIFAGLYVVAATRRFT